MSGKGVNNNNLVMEVDEDHVQGREGSQPCVNTAEVNIHTQVPSLESSAPNTPPPLQRNSDDIDIVTTNTPTLQQQCDGSVSSTPHQQRQSVISSTPVMTIDLAGDSGSDSDVVCLNDMNDSSSVCLSEESINNSVFDFDWGNFPNEYPLYHENQEFRALAKPFIELLVKDGLRCVEHFKRAYFKMPGVDEFFNFLISKRVSRSGWVGLWKIVNTERRGWPLQYLSKAEVLVKSVEFSGPTSYKAELQILHAHDPFYERKRKLTGIQLWQLEPVRSFDESELDAESVECEKRILLLIRKFYETLYVTPDSDSEDITTYFRLAFYERLELVFYMENPTPYAGLLSIKDRGRIIAGIKQFHFLKNSLTEVQAIWRELEDEEDSEDEVDMSNDIEYCESHRKFILLQMQLDRQKVELNFLMKSSLRPLADSLPFTCIEDYDCRHIVVMKEVDISDFNVVHKQLLDSYKDEAPKFRIFTNLELVLRNCGFNANVFVTSGNYSISGLHKLAYGGSLIGIKTGASNDITITPTDDVGDVWLLSSGCTMESNSKLTIKNINFVIDTTDENYLDTGLYVASGLVTIEETSIRNVAKGTGDKKKFIVAKKSSNAVIELSNCDFTFSEAD